MVADLSVGILLCCTLVRILHYPASSAPFAQLNFVCNLLLQTDFICSKSDSPGTYL